MAPDEKPAYPYPISRTTEHMGEIRDRLTQQIAFILEIDQAKRILRQTHLLDLSRRENDAEHSWHLAVMAMVLAEHANEPVDLGKVIEMLLVHDIVEIDAGDTFAYGENGYDDKEEREQRAADRIFGLLPPDQGARFRQLWEEFEARKSPEAKFAAALDRLQPMMHNFFTEGSTWRAYDIPSDRVIGFNQHMRRGSSRLWEYAEGLIETAVREGYLRR